MEQRQFLQAAFGSRLAMGEFYKPQHGSGTDIPTDVARMWFMVNLRDRATDPIAELVKEVSPKYAKLCAKRASIGRPVDWFWPGSYFVKHDLISPDELPEEGWSIERYRHWFNSDLVQERIRQGQYTVDSWGGHWKELIPFQSNFQMALLTWCEKYQMTEDWILEALLQALYSWWRDNRQPKRARLDLEFGHWWGQPSSAQGDPMYSEEMEFVFEGPKSESRLFNLEEDPERASMWKSPRETLRRFTFRHEVGHLLFTRWNLVEERLRDNFEYALSQFKKDLFGFFLAKGYKITPTKTQLDHFSILIDRLVFKKTYAALSAEYGLDIKSIQAALKATKALIEIELPKMPPGRPRKTSRRSNLKSPNSVK